MLGVCCDTAHFLKEFACFPSVCNSPCDSASRGLWPGLSANEKAAIGVYPQLFQDRGEHLFQLPNSSSLRLLVVIFQHTSNATVCRVTSPLATTVCDEGEDSELGVDAVRSEWVWDIFA